MGLPFIYCLYWFSYTGECLWWIKTDCWSERALSFLAQNKSALKKKSNLFWDHPSSGPECCSIHLWETLLPLVWYSVVSRQMPWVALAFLFKLNFRSKSLSEHGGPPASQEHSWFLVYAEALPTGNLEKPRIQSIGRDISSSLICFQRNLLGDFTVKFSWRGRPEIITTALIMRTQRTENTHQRCSEFPNQLKWKRFQSSRISPSQGGECNSHPLNAGYSLCMLKSTLCNPMDCSLPGSSVHGNFQARILEWVASFFFRESSWPRDWTQVSCITGRFFTDWAIREALPLWFPSKKHSMEVGWEVMMQQRNSSWWRLALPEKMPRRFRSWSGAHS